MQKGFDFSRGPTWMRHGTQGHVAQPRGPARVTALHDVTCAYLYLLVIEGYSTYMHPIFRIEDKPYISRTLYTRHVLLNSSVWDY